MNNKTTKVFLITIGVLGFLAGIFLVVNKNYIIGASGSLASLGIVLKEVTNLKKEKK